MQKNDHFSEKAKNWDRGNKRLQTVNAIAENILSDIHLTKEFHLLDFGSGTGLLTERLAPEVKKITCIDTSPAMNAKLLAKELPCSIDLQEIDVTQEDIEGVFDDRFDGIVSSMTLHHIEDIQALFEKFYKLLKDDAFIALADLLSEDGKFHSDNTGVFHFGFDADEIQNIAKNTGFKDIHIKVVNSIEKPHNSYDVFLLTAKK